MAKSLGSYRGYGCFYERGIVGGTFTLTFYRHGYTYKESFKRDTASYEQNLGYLARRIIDQQYRLKESTRYEDLPDPALPKFLKELPR